MSCFVKSTTPPNITPLDPNKHVNFSLGMVLGVDDLSQEFAYHDEHLHSQARDLLGYGTAAGLKISKENLESGGGWRVSVSPGSALNARGQMVVVDDTYCAYLGPWLHDHQGDQDAVLPDQDANEGIVRLFLTLDYRSCLTDDLPVPGEPCRTEDAVTAPSRVKDSFCLQFSWQKPDQREEDGLRDFVDWLRKIEVRQGGLPEGYSLSSFEDVIRNSANPDLTSPDFMPGAPDPDLYIPEDNACEFLASAFRIWTTELRPKCLNKGAAYGAGSQVDPPFPHAPTSGAILLAAVNFSVRRGVVSNEWVANIQSDGSDLILDESTRPYLIHLRMLQEWMICGRESRIVPGDTVKEECSFDLPFSAGEDEHYSRADHTHGTPALPELSGDVTGEIIDNKLSAIQKTPVEASTNLSEGQALTLINDMSTEVPILKWKPIQPYGDVRDKLTDNRIFAIQTTPVSADPEMVDLTQGSVLTLMNVMDGEENHLEWQPVEPNGDVQGELNNNLLKSIQGIPLNGVSPVRIPQDNGKVMTLVEIPALGDTPAHLEWMPSTPQGDVTGDLTSTVLSAIQTTPVSADPDQIDLREGDVLALVNTGQDGGQNMEWQPAGLSGDLSGKIMENSLTAIQNTRVLASAPFVTLDAGQVLTVVRTNEGFIWKPEKPATTASTTSVEMSGDATGNSASNIVEGLWDTQIKKPDPSIDKGKALIYMSDHWELGSTGPAQTGSFVEKPGEKPFRIVAAGVVRVSFSRPNGNTVSMISSFNGLDLMPDSVSFCKFSLTFSDFDQRMKNKENLIVKALPRCNFDTPFTVFLVNMKAGSGIEFGIFSLTKVETFDGEIHVEISSFDQQG